MKMNLNSKKKRILIVGGGVAGASLAIRLANQNFEISVVERDKFPRHKLCGEFVSPECIRHFENLGVIDSISEIGGDAISETRFFSEKGKSLRVPSEWFFKGGSGALGISRAEMDFRLLQKARELGVEIVEETKCVGVKLNGEKMSAVSVRDKDHKETEIAADLFVDATGRSGVLGKLVNKSRGRKENKTKIRHIGFKAHFENVKLEKGVCEIYFFRGGYGGLNYVENGTANHCFLIDSRVAREFKGNADTILENVIFENVRARVALKGAEKKFEWLGVSVERFGKQRENDCENLISIGDSAAFIDPFTGSGMLMALESSELLSKTILAEGEALNLGDIRSVKARFEDSHARAIRKRLRVCSLIHRLSFSPKLAGLVISVGGLSEGAVKMFASLTRPAENAR